MLFRSARFLEDLFALIRIPSVSAKSEHKPDMQRCAEHWRDHLLQVGAQKAEILYSLLYLFLLQITSYNQYSILSHSRYNVLYYDIYFYQ